MADILRNLSRGDRISLISAGQVNLWNEAARRVRGEAFDLGFEDAETRRNSAIIDVRNNTADDLPRFAVVALSGMGVEPTENENQALANPFMEGTAPGNPNDRETIGILVDPLSADSIGRAVIVGATWVKVSVSTGEENYQYCKVSNGVTANMVMSSARGPAQILWKESGTGTKWAYVLIDNQWWARGWYSWVEKSAGYSASVWEAVICDLSTASFTVTLPQFSVCKEGDRVLVAIIRNITANRIVSIAPYSGDKINGSTSNWVLTDSGTNYTTDGSAGGYWEFIRTSSSACGWTASRFLNT